MNSETWFINQNGVWMGPATDTALREFARRGLVIATTHVSRDGVEWAKASDIDQIEFGPPVHDELWYYRRGDDERVGPIPGMDLAQLCKDGQVSRQTLVSQDDKHWQFAGNVERFAGLLGMSGRLPALMSIDSVIPAGWMAGGAFIAWSFGSGAGVFTVFLAALVAGYALYNRFYLPFTEGRPRSWRPDLAPADRDQAWAAHLDEQKNLALYGVTVAASVVFFVVLYRGHVAANDQKLGKEVSEDLQANIYHMPNGKMLHFTFAPRQTVKNAHGSDVHRPFTNLTYCNFTVTLTDPTGKQVQGVLAPVNWSRDVPQTLDIPFTGTVSSIGLKGECTFMPDNRVVQVERIFPVDAKNANPPP